VTSDGTSKTILPGRPVGGLLLMHTLYMVSVLSIIDPVLKTYMKDCLIWIGREMRIGQATMLSAEEGPPTDLFDFLGEAHVLIWASMLL